MFEQLKKTAEYIQSFNKITPEVGIVLGSGLGSFVDEIENPVKIPYAEIPNFMSTTVEGHQGQLILGSIAGVNIVVMQGRVHLYEGLPMENIVFPIRVLATLGIKSLILTNAAGGINTNFSHGDLVVIDDHINFMGSNPLIGPNISELGPRFPDMTQAYNHEVKKCIFDAAKTLNKTLQSGVYAAMMGPTYETPAEINMLRTVGADMVGMSTVPEAIAANHLGLRVGGISCITNMAAGIENVTLKHEDVKIEALKVMNLFSSIIKGTLKNLANK